VLLSVDKPTKGKACLLTQFDVLSLLHETGHPLHNLVSETQFGVLHGTGVARDFVEVHATVLEKFMTIPRFLRQMSCHYAHLSPEHEKAWRKTAGDSVQLPYQEIPDHLISTILEKSKDFSLFRSYANLAASFFDMAVHNPESHETLEKINLAGTFNRIHRDIRLLHGPEALGGTLDWGCAYAQFRHLSSSYDAQYYTYLRQNRLHFRQIKS